MNRQFVKPGEYAKPRESGAEQSDAKSGKRISWFTL